MPGKSSRAVRLIATVFAVIFIGLSNANAQEHGRPSVTSINRNAYLVPIDVAVNCSLVPNQIWPALIQNVDRKDPDKGVSPRLWGKLIKVGFICLFLVGAGAVWLFNKLKAQ